MATTAASTTIDTTIDTTTDTISATDTSAATISDKSHCRIYWKNIKNYKTI